MDPALEPVLSKSILKIGNREVMRFLPCSPRSLPLPLPHSPRVLSLSLSAAASHGPFQTPQGHSTSDASAERNASRNLSGPRRRSIPSALRHDEWMRKGGFVLRSTRGCDRIKEERYATAGSCIDEPEPPRLHRHTPAPAPPGQRGVGAYSMCWRQHVPKVGAREQAGWTKASKGLEADISDIDSTPGTRS